MNADILDRLAEVLAERRTANPNDSYVASLYAAGLNKMLEKVGEEATEVILAARDAELNASDREHLAAEVADLWFHCMVVLSHLDLSHAQVLEVLAQRFGISGHAEKAARAPDDGS